jgi:hypothetical protein
MPSTPGWAAVSSPSRERSNSQHGFDKDGPQLMNAAMANSSGLNSPRRTQRHYSHDGTVGSKGSLGGQVGEGECCFGGHTGRHASGQAILISKVRDMEVVQVRQEENETKQATEAA